MSFSHCLLQFKSISGLRKVGGGGRGGGGTTGIYSKDNYPIYIVFFRLLLASHGTVLASYVLVSSLSHFLKKIQWVVHELCNFIQVVSRLARMLLLN